MQWRIVALQARNALLAAYYVLDEDGAKGLSEVELVGVLTAEAGIGVNVAQASAFEHPLPAHDEWWIA